MVLTFRYKNVGQRAVVSASYGSYKLIGIQISQSVELFSSTIQYQIIRKLFGFGQSGRLKFSSSMKPNKMVKVGAKIKDEI